MAHPPSTARTARQRLLDAGSELTRSAYTLDSEKVALAFLTPAGVAAAGTSRSTLYRNFADGPSDDPFTNYLTELAGELADIGVDLGELAATALASGGAPHDILTAFAATTTAGTQDPDTNLQARLNIALTINGTISDDPVKARSRDIGRFCELICVKSGYQTRDGITWDTVGAAICALTDGMIVAASGGDDTLLHAVDRGDNRFWNGYSVAVAAVIDGMCEHEQGHQNPASP